MIVEGTLIDQTPKAPSVGQILNLYTRRPIKTINLFASQEG